MQEVRLTVWALSWTYVPSSPVLLAPTKFFLDRGLLGDNSYIVKKKEEKINLWDIDIVAYYILIILSSLISGEYLTCKGKTFITLNKLVTLQIEASRWKCCFTNHYN